MSRPASRRRAPGRPGFSLILSLTVMAMLLLLCISVAALMAVELRVARASVNQARARLNAMTGARLALAQLQTLTGPDQRITATADLIGKSPLNQSVPTSPAQARRRHWTGVWAAGGVDKETLHEWSPLSPNKKAFAGWLVSHADQQGAYTPLETPLNRSGLQNAATPQTPNLLAVTLPENTGDVLLVGPGTVGGDGDTRQDFVSAPRVTLTGSAGENAGGFAYWVGDEGVKATLNVADPLSGSLDASRRFDSVSDAERTVRMGVAGRRAAELITDPKDKSPIFAEAASAWLNEIKATQSAGTTPYATALENNIVTSAGFPLWYESRGGRPPESDSLRRIFHHTTAFNRGLLTDTRNGGFKVDLSSAFELDFDSYKILPEFAASPEVITGFTTNDALAKQAMERKLGYVFEFSPAAGASAAKGPVWDLLRNHYRLYKRERETGKDAANISLSGSARLAHGAEPYTYAFTGATLAPDPVAGPIGDGKQKLNFALRQPVWTGKPAVSLAAESYPSINKPIVPFTRAALSPRVTRVVLRFSLVYINNAIGIGIDPVVYLHNPYNVPITFAGISLDFASINNVMFTIKRRADDKIVSRLSLGDIAGRQPYGDPYSANNTCKRGFAFRILKTGGDWNAAPTGPITLAPGEIRIANCTGSNDRWQVYDQNSYTNSIPGDIMNYSTTLNFRINARAFDSANGVTSGTELTSASTVNNATNIPATPPATTASTSPLYVEISTEPDSATAGAQAKLCSFDVHLLRPETYLGADKTRIARRSIHGILQFQKEEAYYDMSDDHLIQRINVNFGSGPLFSNKAPIITSNDFQKANVNDGTTNLVSGKNIFGLLDIRMRSLADGSSTTPGAGPALLPVSFNPRAYLVDPRNADGSASSASTASIWQAGFASDSAFGSTITRDTADPTRGFWGSAYDASGQQSVVLYDIPQTPAVSLAALGHADVALLDSQPALHLGNSYAPPMFDSLNKAIRVPSAGSIEQYDLTFAMNEALYDRYFFSGLAWLGKSDSTGSTQAVPQALAAYAWPKDLPDAFRRLAAPSASEPYPLFNKSLRFDRAHANQEAFEKPVQLPAALARQLYVPGAFNVNSTSVEAWKALLGTLAGEGPGGYKANSASPYIYSRLTTPPAEAAQNPFTGALQLSADQIEKIAAAIVEQVKARGPFMSTADFVNRRLDANAEIGGKGALQAALDRAALPHLAASGAPSLTSNAKFPALANYPTGQGSGAAGTLAHPLQMDLLHAIGGVITPRSDTFIIRAYGDASDGTSSASAICEMTVVRTADWIDTKEDIPAVELNTDYRTATTAQPLMSPFKRSGQLKSAQVRFGRRYQVVSRRWLADSEI